MFAFFNKNDPATDENVELDAQRIPAHVAIIMDGNGRWAKSRHLPRVAGHKEGMNTVKKITIAASDLGVKVLTLYAFSTENWKRPTDEVNYLMQLPVSFFDTFVPDLVKHNVRVQVMGYTDQLPAKTQKAVRDAVADTQACDGMVLNFALNYGSRAEMVTGIQAIAQQVQAGKLTVDQIDERTVDDALMTSALGQYHDPDLLIRTSGEERISNFLLWQIAYSELVFTDVKWPDFTATTLKACIADFQHRDRRFGGLSDHK
ncbi:isoprenyl transferase [Lactiplantibacillus mudanjiangensis]|uniref:Isoprenyl transferase n=1 Tax=Lactiplantibacillus mudanjiangensis TaxID=1296538 RepID=A0A660E203_9LACO|nr:isoprenyl transferase [Lactiplantibacillus mudanjiangensis]VDG20586.1 di-trans-poly-cis-decaprenylcistransferase [Lactobacillus plantarum JDM1] [Lactiplantibacillus mudanjiangensis]VDG24578.1 di-trans-poly-cis-decaprenylcistransferase [Lactobacillus plantarum JDM1] [Lactiplantibacillus mudanjiangensis]VDG28625.1 di-trans-poly-cis-decaprenylcistransferase [Lactobacillus plantarum JDM1] [Lactiplantibacillus mudanjiangensis]VDG30676.1 di-trans-poly-cis-decaprenylcistransferase [Lactobacillus pl